MKAFYLVFKKNGTSMPLHIHEYLKDAEDEAKRLAAKLGREVFVMKSVMGFVPAQAPITVIGITEGDYQAPVAAPVPKLIVKEMEDL